YFNKIKILLKFLLRQMHEQPKAIDSPGVSESRFSPSFFPKGFVLFNSEQLPFFFDLPSLQFGKKTPSAPQRPLRLT
ncbi:MAG: hypothetical protein IKI17_07285, partial [Oscillospiraceae bacterium]|nr:hypothetical protein [Oscillospiraceae bacterium]